MRQFDAVETTGIVCVAVILAVAIMVGVEPASASPLKQPTHFKAIERHCTSIGDGAEAIVQAREAKIAEIEAAKAEAEKAKKAAAKRQAKKQAGTRGGSGNNFKRDGEWFDDEWRYTWYSSNVLHHKDTEQWTPDENGIYRDSDGYAVVASVDKPKGSVIEDTPFGDAKVYDSGCPEGTLDVYVNF